MGEVNLNVVLNSRKMWASFWKKIRKQLDFTFLHYPSTQHLYLLAVGAMVGVLGGLGAVLFRWSIGMVQQVAYGSQQPLGYIFHIQDIGLLRLFLPPLIAAAVIGPITWYFLENVRGAGVPDVLESMNLRHGRVVWYIAPLKLLVSSLSLGTIASVGREGPIVQIGSSLGSMMNQFVSMPRRHLRVLTACGGAAGLSATFNTPIGGAFFILEVVLGSFSSQHFVPIVIASVTGTVVGQRFLGAQPAFQLMERFSFEQPLEMLVYAALGVIGGILAYLLIRCVDLFRDGFDALPIPDLFKPVVGGMVLLGIGLSYFPQVIGVGYETIEVLIGAQSSSPLPFLETSVQFLVLLILFKMIAVGISLGCGFSGGIFSPALFIGASAGYVVGFLANQYLAMSMAPPQAYAIAGMATVFAGTANAPVSTLIIIFEMTQDYQIVLPLMICCSVSTLIARLLTAESIYTSKLMGKGIDIHETPEELVMNQLEVEDVMRSAEEEPVLSSDSTFREITQAFLGHGRDHLFVVDDEERVQGVISLHEVKRAFSDIDQVGTLVRAVDVMDADVPLIPLEATLSEAMNELWRTHYDELPVVESLSNPTFRGVIWEHDIIGVYNREILKQKASLMKTVHQEEGEEQTDYLELPDGYTVDQIQVPDGWRGTAIRELGVREKYGIMIVEIKREKRYGEIERLSPEPDMILTGDDTLIVMGPDESIDQLRSTPWKRD